MNELQKNRYITLNKLQKEFAENLNEKNRRKQETEWTLKEDYEVIF